MISRPVLLAVAFLALTAGTAPAQDSVNVLQFALSNPTDNAQIATPPSLGDSVPQSVALRQPDPNSSLAYFYYNGQPVIVDLKTRSVVRVGQ
ncbi:DUF1236 domain-containing protein [Aurantimonas sp. HBX-1]|uniref:DUF1236 domain-containing protein n=1 Tax=Aurantimonas sp. HBX-1 TaxID=2906072 RepID=UPI001F417257|nr:DUF1236 domain-containing protein [Aurantimonas sp. HBX-1]UIJ71650.1 DUF1236 domain-containing protein [Aurantimonas sp. HBX-1]